MPLCPVIGTEKLQAVRCFISDSTHITAMLGTKFLELLIVILLQIEYCNSGPDRLRTGLVLIPRYAVKHCKEKLLKLSLSERSPTMKINYI